MVATIVGIVLTAGWEVLKANDFAIPRAIISYATGSAS